MLIQQRNDEDCALCCLAMLYDVPYEEMVTRIGVQASSALGTNLSPALSKLGFSDFTGADQNGNPESPELVYDQSYREGLSVSQRLARYPDHRALLSVRSLNSEKGWHVVFWDGQALHDPSTLNRYTGIDEIEEARGIILFKPSEVGLPAHLHIGID